jgi:hypothetical protein
LKLNILLNENKMNKENIKMNDIVWVKIATLDPTIIYEGPAKVISKAFLDPSRKGVDCQFPFKIKTSNQQPNKKHVSYVYFREILFKIK